MSVLTKNQTREFRAEWRNRRGEDCALVATVRHDDRCNNGHNTFSVTANLYKGGRAVAAGCMHKDIAQRIPELAPFLKWHLVSTDGPPYYVDNTLYWLGFTHWEPANLAHARKCAVWPDLPESFAACPTDTEEARKACAKAVEATLRARLPKLMADFRAAVESLGFVY